MSNSVYIVERIVTDFGWEIIPDDSISRGAVIGFTDDLHDAYLALDGIQDELQHTEWFVDGGYTVEADMASEPHRLVAKLGDDTCFTVEVSEINRIPVMEH